MKLFCRLHGDRFKFQSSQQLLEFNPDTNYSQFLFYLIPSLTLLRTNERHSFLCIIHFSPFLSKVNMKMSFFLKKILYNFIRMLYIQLTNQAAPTRLELHLYVTRNAQAELSSTSIVSSFCLLFNQLFQKYIVYCSQLETTTFYKFFTIIYIELMRNGDFKRLLHKIPFMCKKEMISLNALTRQKNLSLVV